METMHIHDVYEIYMTQSSGIKFAVNNRTYELDRGDVMLFTDADLHKAIVPKNSKYERYVITFLPYLLQEEDRAVLLECFGDSDRECSHKLQLTPEEQRMFITLVEELKCEQKQQWQSEKGQLLSLCKLLLFLNRIFREKQQVSPVSIHSFDPRIRTVLEYIDDNYIHQPSLDELAKMCYLNKYYLCRLFRKETGFSISDYITYRRMSIAMKLLRKGESISNVARLSGFKSDTYFITSFKKNFGTTPYRYMHRSIQ
ncbi:MAG: helix-turn-helix transcriptional regulator [Clostridia bacterium]|nr:helix-turn-helix transcriptional regulator [Clostridia bacterium]